MVRREERELRGEMRNYRLMKRFSPVCYWNVQPPLTAGPQKRPQID